MTTILETIKASAELRALADAGHDAAVADAINAAARQAVPVTVAALSQAAPQTLTAIRAGSTARADLIEIGTLINASNYSWMSIWATALLMMGTMPQAEYDAVVALIAAAIPVAQVSHQQVSNALNQIRPHDGEAVRAMPIDWSKI